MSGESAAATKLADQIQAGTLSTATDGAHRDLPVTHITAHRGWFDWRPVSYTHLTLPTILRV